MKGIRSLRTTHTRQLDEVLQATSMTEQHPAYLPLRQGILGLPPPLLLSRRVSSAGRLALRRHQRLQVSKVSVRVLIPRTRTGTPDTQLPLRSRCVRLPDLTYSGLLTRL